MAIEQSLRSKLDEVLGEEHAGELMERLPGDKPATKVDIERLETDIEQLETRFDLKLESMENRLLARMGTMQYELMMVMVSQTRNFIIAMAGIMLSLGAALLVANR